VAENVKYYFPGMFDQCLRAPFENKTTCLSRALSKERLAPLSHARAISSPPARFALCKLSALVAVLAFVCTTTGAPAATTYYAATTGSSGNSGLSTGSPWPLSYALANAGAGNTVIVLSGTYSGDWEINYPLTLRSQTKWGARLVNMPYGLIIGYSANASGTVVDGFEIAYSSHENVDIYSPNCTIRNCWIHDAGINSRPNNTADVNSGVHSLEVNGTTVEYCLLENNGSSGGYDHGIYISGSNLTVRGNVMRGNWGFGLCLYNTFGDIVGNTKVYDNLIYGNGVHTVNNWDGAYVVPRSGQTAYLWNNTILAQNGPPIQGAYGTVCLTNNIILGPGGSMFSIVSQTILSDYNLSTSALTYAGPHDVVSTTPNFVNPSSGLYWLTGTSPARNKANPNVLAPVDFFGRAQSSVADIGAFQYDGAYLLDSRVLDPSPSGGPDYWQNLGGGTGGTPAISVNPLTQSFGSLLVGTTSDRAFTVLNTGSGTLSGSASVPAPFAIISGNSYSLAPGQSQAVTVRYAPTTAGSTTQTVLFTGGPGANAMVSGAATNAPSGGFTFQASAGALTAPFVVTNGYVCQFVDTENADGGRAVFSFTTITAGVYVVSAVINAPNGSQNSFYVTMDGTQPSEPYTVWDVPITSGFQTQTVAWRGNGTWDADQFVPKAFALSAGAHSLVIVGREPNTQLQSIQIQSARLTAPPPPLVLQIVPGP
jgi:hypothetical protein